MRAMLQLHIKNCFMSDQVHTRDVRDKYFYPETSNFKLAQKCSFHPLEMLPVARNAKFQPMYPLLGGVIVR